MLCILLLALISSIDALPEGAPSKACQSLLPFHGGGILPQFGIPPYTIGVRRASGAVEVSIASPLGVKFQGFLLQGRMPNGEVIGTFQLEPEAEAHAITCAELGDSITHKSPGEKNFLTALWIPPEGYEGPVMFNSTIAENYQTFWVGVPSPTIQVSKRSPNDPPLPRPPGRRPQTSTPPYFQPDRPRQTSTEFDQFYAGCATTKLCFGAPEGCVSSRSCKAVAAVNVIGDRYEFELKAEGGPAWVGVGLSDDAKMGDDSVIECVKGPNGVVGAYQSWTTARPYSAQRLSNVLNNSRRNGTF